MSNRIETIYTIISKDNEIIRFTNYLFDEYYKIIAFIVTLDNKKVIYDTIQGFIDAHSILCESISFISYIESKNTNDIETLKLLHKYTKTKQDVEIIYQAFSEILSRNICHNDKGKDKCYMHSFKQILMYQKVIQNYYNEIAKDNEILENLIHRKFV
jgi:hypothetical protein